MVATTLTASVVVISLVAAACSNGSSPSTTEAAATTTTTQPTEDPADPGSVLDDVPDAARASTNAADPRQSAYWVMWSTCGEGSQAETAVANGGRAAGWILVDDLLDDPGMAVGDYVVSTCTVAVDLLDQADGGPTTENSVSALAGQLLTAQLNLNVGAETCPAAEEAVVAGHVVLSEADFSGSRASHDEPLFDSDGTARIAQLLSAYNSGELCR